MDTDWHTSLQDHPIFRPPEQTDSLELSTSTLPKFAALDPNNDTSTPSGRRQTMLIHDSELIVAAGKELRMASLNELKLAGKSARKYKTLHTPNVQFQISQMAINSNGKLLAVAGAFQVAVVVLPRAGFNRLVPDTIDCKSVQIGQFYHASKSSVPIAKIGWHPWGEAGSTLMVMTIDGKFREYDVSMDPEEPQQTLSFVPDRKGKSFLAEDPAEREVASFTLGKGIADWGPLTIYAVMKSGDIYSICPYLPVNASLPSAYIHSLECFVSAKQEYLAQGSSADSRKLSSLYDYHHKYVSSLVKQLPPGTQFPSSSRFVSIHPPKTVKLTPLRQGPYLLQPSPRPLNDSDGGDATDIAYIAFGHNEEEDNQGETDSLGVVMVTFQDGRVDVYLDVEKAEARWEIKQSPIELPMLAVYENTDLGLITLLKGTSGSLDLLQGNHPVIHPDPIHDDSLYVYHAFGVHSLDLGPLIESLAVALRADDSEGQNTLETLLQQPPMTKVSPILSTYSIGRCATNPVVGVAIPNDVYLTYSIFMLTSTMRITSFPLNFRSEPSKPRLPSLPPPVTTSEVETKSSSWLTPKAGLPPYVSLLGDKPFTIPAILENRGLPSQPRLAIGTAQQKQEFMLTPETLRYLGTTVEKITNQVHQIQLAYRETIARASLQMNEAKRQQDKCNEMQTLLLTLTGPRRDKWKERVGKAQENQKKLISRLDRILQAMMESASPELSELEKAWFEELRKMKEEIVGLGKYDEGSLISRAKLLSAEYDRILPALESLTAKDLERRKQKAKETLGASQAFEYGEKSSTERAQLRRLEATLEQLASGLDISVGTPPSKR